MRPLSESTLRIVNKNCSRKYVALGRIVNQWSEIVGAELADKAQPIKMNYRKSPLHKKPSATLEIATTSAHATILSYQKGLILERINRIFGDQWITDIRLVTTPAKDSPVLRRKSPQPLTGERVKYLSESLCVVTDAELKQKLELLGKAILEKAILTEK